VSTSPTAIQFASSHEQTDFRAGDCKDENYRLTDQNSTASDLLVRCHHALRGLPGNYGLRLCAYTYTHSCCASSKLEFN